ncbi:MAG: alkaline phosphatase family protein, partial [Methanobacteriota archaeon]
MLFRTLLNKRNLPLIFVAVLLIPSIVFGATSDDSIKVNIVAPSQIKPGDTLKLWVFVSNLKEEFTIQSSQSALQQVDSLSSSTLTKITINKIEFENPFQSKALSQQEKVVNRKLTASGDALKLRKLLREELYNKLSTENVTLEQLKAYADKEEQLNKLIAKGRHSSLIEIPVPKDSPEGTTVTIPIKVSYSSEGSLSAQSIDSFIQVTVTSNPVPKKAVIIIVDGAKRDAMYQYADGNSSSYFSELMRSGAKFTETETIFPSITPPGHAAILTGTYPKNSGIAGFRWFNKATREYTDYGDIWSKITYKVDEDLQAQTIFEALGPKYTHSVFEFIRKGADEKWYPSAGMLRDYEAGDLNIPPGSMYWYQKLDKDTTDRVIYELIPYYSKDLIVLWLAGNDLIGHKLGPDATYGTGSMSNVDAQIGRLMNGETQVECDEFDCYTVTYPGLWDGETLFVITADHGQTEVTKDDAHAITQNEVVNDLYPKGYYCYGVPYVYIEDADCVVAPNGGMAQIYIQNGLTFGDGSVYDGTWTLPPTWNDIYPAVDYFYPQPYVDTVLVKYQGS